MSKSLFKSLITPHQPTPEDILARRWIYVPYDRNTARTGPLTEQPPAQTGIILVETTAKALRRPYHKKKLIVLLSNMRHFALEQAALGVKVLYHWSRDSHGQALLHLQQTHNLPTLTVMSPAERELRPRPRRSRYPGPPPGHRPRHHLGQHLGGLPRHLRPVPTWPLLRHGPLLPPHASEDHRPHDGY